MVFQHTAVALAPADGQVAGGDQGPALLGGGDDFAVDVGGDLRGIGSIILEACAVRKPQGQGMGGLKAALLTFAQFQAGTEDFQALQLRSLGGGPEQGGAEEHRLAFRQADGQVLGEIGPLFGEFFRFGGDDGGFFVAGFAENGGVVAFAVLVVGPEAEGGYPGISV